MSKAHSVTAERPRRSLVFDMAGYMGGQIGVMLVGFITFPIFTRLLSKQDYGLLAITNTTLTFALLLVGLGLPNAIVRLSPQYAGDLERSRKFNTSILALSTAAAVAGALLLLLAPFWMPVRGGFGQLGTVLPWVCAVLVSRAAMNIVYELFRIHRRVVAYNCFAILTRASNAVCAAAGFFLSGTLEGFLLGLALGELLIGVVGVSLSRRWGFWGWVKVEGADMSHSVSFAFPLMLGSLCGSLNAYSDRYLITGFLGAEAVAAYAVAYDLCAHVQMLFSTSYRLGALPELVKKYVNEGAEETAAFLARSVQHFSWLIVGSGFGLVAVGQDVIVLLASAKYRDSYVLLPYLVPGVVLYGLNFVFGAGIYLQKKTRVSFLVSLSAALFNIGLNFVLLPRMGVLGAAVATLVTYVLQALAYIVISRRYLPTRFNTASALRTLLCGGVMFWFVRLLPGGDGQIGWLLARVALGAVVYVTLLLAVEKDARNLAGRLVRDRKLAL